MSSRYLGVISLQRYLVVERYCESHQASSSTHPRRSLGVDRTGGRDGKPDSSSRTGAPAQARQR
ncbi:MAG TPA: hypothetical protein VHS79_09380 [Actinomycetes bacterium]|nr:hypothetical protein [Actinomycetes bacterium]